MRCPYVKTTNVYVLWRNHILLIKRSATDTNLPNFWESPGGHVDLKVHLSDNIVARKEAVREVFEESGLALNPAKLQLYSINPSSCHIAYIYDFDSKVPPKITLSFEHSKFCWKNCNFLLKNLRREVKSFILKELCR